MGIDFIYGKCIFTMSFMILIIILSIAFWLMYKTLKKSNEWKNYLILTINVIYETLYSNLVNLLAKSMTCAQLGTKFFSSQNLNISCFDEEFEKWVYFINMSLI